MKKNPEWLIGIDEVGRGPLAGPVAVGAFAIKHGLQHMINNDERIRDSKQISEQKRGIVRDALLPLIEQGICKFEIGIASHSMIDRKGIVHAIMTATEDALKKLGIHPMDADIYLDGGLKAPISYFRQHTIIGGDKTLRVISAASIMAKLHRDQLMDDYDLKFPGYGFLNHKGYGTPEHYRALKVLGPSPIHRLTFIK